MSPVTVILFVFNGLTGSIQGIVNDASTDKPIAFANIMISGTEIGSASDNAGNFIILSVTSGNYRLEVSCIGYQTAIIENVVVAVDLTTRLTVFLSQSVIELEPITVLYKKPAITKDMVGTTYITRKDEIFALPIDYAMEMLALHPAVAMAETAMHVRGGRAKEVNYLIDNVSIIDPQTGDPAISMSKGVIDEVLFLPGGFDVEYGRAMSGIVNVVTELPAEKLQGRLFGKTESFMPWYYDFGYNNAQAFLHLPFSRHVKGLYSIDLLHTDDWDPRLFIEPHKQRDDYTLYGKLHIPVSPKLNIALTATQSRSQFDRYHHKFKFHLDHYRSDWRKSDLEIVNVNNIVKDNLLINMTLSRLFTRRIYGVRESGPYGLFDDFRFRDYNTMRLAQPGYMNPFGVYIRYFRIEGDDSEYRNTSSLVMSAKVNAQYVVNKNNEINCGIDYSSLDLGNFSHWVSDTLHPQNDEYRYYPNELSAYVQNNFDYPGIFAKVGCRFERYDNGMDSVSFPVILSPRTGVSFLITNNILFRTNIGKYIQPPEYEKYYTYYNLLPFPSYFPMNLMVGNPKLKPEQTIAYEMGFQGEFRKNLLVNINAFYKDITDLLGSRFVSALPKSYVTYMNVEFARVRGIELVTEMRETFFTGRLSYTLSWAKGTSSYAEEVYYRYYYEDPDTSFTPPAVDYYLDFDQRHRVLFQGELDLPGDVKLYVLNFWGNGFPYTPPGEEGKTEVRNFLRFKAREQLDCVLTKGLRIGMTRISVTAEAINIFDSRYQITLHQPWISLSRLRHSDFDDYVSILNPYYHPASDLNHDGMMSPSEEFTCFREILKETDDWVGAYSSPRRVRIGISLSLE